MPETSTRQVVTEKLPAGKNNCVAFQCEGKSPTPNDIAKNKKPLHWPLRKQSSETAGTLPFWLYGIRTDGKYKAATEIKAHQAYLICMPNNDKYPSGKQYQW